MQQPLKSGSEMPSWSADSLLGWLQYNSGYRVNIYRDKVGAWDNPENSNVSFLLLFWVEYLLCYEH